MAHTNLTEVTGVVLVKVGAVVVLTTGLLDLDVTGVHKKSDSGRIGRGEGRMVEGFKEEGLRQRSLSLSGTTNQFWKGCTHKTTTSRVLAVLAHTSVTGGDVAPASSSPHTHTHRSCRDPSRERERAESQ